MKDCAEIGVIERGAKAFGGLVAAVHSIPKHAVIASPGPGARRLLSPREEAPCSRRDGASSQAGPIHTRGTLQGEAGLGRPGLPDRQSAPGVGASPQQLRREVAGCHVDLASLQRGERGVPRRPGAWLNQGRRLHSQQSCMRPDAAILVAESCAVCYAPSWYVSGQHRQEG